MLTVGPTVPLVRSWGDCVQPARRGTGVPPASSGLLIALGSPGRVTRARDVQVLAGVVSR
jgi:hypothetical protein